jgi:hypothetical protein
MREGKSRIGAGHPALVFIPTLHTRFLPSSPILTHKITTAKREDALTDKEKAYAEKDRELGKECALLNGKIVEYNKRARVILSMPRFEPVCLL